jgi:hypothetical protein
MMGRAGMGKATVITGNDVYDCERDEYEIELALARLLAEGVVFLNNHWWREDWPEDARKSTAIAVNCNDTFHPASDAELVMYTEIADLYRLWEKDPRYGPTVWCMNKRGTQPMQPLAMMIEAAGYTLPPRQPTNEREGE